MEEWIARHLGNLPLASALLRLNRRVEAPELDAGVLGPELPVDSAAGGVAPVLPG
jgi:hypothetical protein